MPEEYLVEIKLLKTELDGSVSSTAPWRITKETPDLFTGAARNHPELEELGHIIAYELHGKLKEHLEAHSNYVAWMKKLMQAILILRTEPDQTLALERVFQEVVRARVFEQMRLDTAALPDHTTKLMSLVTAAKALLKDPQNDAAYGALLSAAEDL